MTEFEADLLEKCNVFCLAIHAWYVLPNHYHVVVKSDESKRCAMAWDCFTVVHPLVGTAKIASAGVRFGITASSALSNRSATFGPR